MRDTEEVRGRLRTWGEKPRSVAILMDLDGPLAPIVPTPDTSEVLQRLRDLLRRPSGRLLLVAAVSGRKPDEALKLIGHEDIMYVGNHGFEVLRDGEVRMIPEAIPYLEKVQELENLTRMELAPRSAFVEENVWG